MLWLKNLNDVPPGEFWYRQTEGISKTFEGSPLIQDTAGRVSAFRSANNLPRPGLQESLIDVIQFTVNRLGKSEWVYDTDLPAETLIARPSGGGCAGCGAKL